MKTNPDEAAFAGVTENRYDPKLKKINPGLTKREYLAVLALQGILANPNKDYMTRDAADYAIESADDLIAELNEEAPNGNPNQ